MAADAASIAITALTLEGTELQAYLQDACGEDAELRAAVTGLMQAGAQADQFFSGLAARSGLPSANDTADATAEADAVPSQAFGPYRLVRPLGAGGMGAVYLAERNDAQFEQQVAIKTLPAGFRSGALQARFLQERQILARLNHPHIAGLQDGGVAEDGTPFLAMEYVDGLRIDHYCDRERLNLRQRVALFIDVCDGVDYAHRNLVVHRDIKPDNVLIDASGNAKLLDFGIARLIDDEHAQSLTQVAGAPLTPRYASPEQLTGAPANVASDVYTLGVLLYELLTGLSPYGDVRQGNELRSAIIDGQVQLPRTALASRSKDQLEILANSR
ncbi:MAG: serine/threonine-protein kinase, partial [Pseudomonadales bacterium]